MLDDASAERNHGTARRVRSVEARRKHRRTVEGGHPRCEERRRRAVCGGSAGVHDEGRIGARCSDPEQRARREGVRSREGRRPDGQARNSALRVVVPGPDEDDVVYDDRVPNARERDRGAPGDRCGLHGVARRVDDVSVVRHPQDLAAGRHVEHGRRRQRTGVRLGGHDDVGVDRGVDRRQHVGRRITGVVHRSLGRDLARPRVVPGRTAEVVGTRTEANRARGTQRFGAAASGRCKPDDGDEDRSDHES